MTNGKIDTKAMTYNPKSQNPHLQSQKKAEYTEKRSDSDQYEAETKYNTEETPSSVAEYNRRRPTSIKLKLGKDDP